MSDFVPPYPYRMPTLPTFWQRFRLWRRNMLAIWEERAFEYEFVSTKVLNRRVFLCNSPDSVQFAFGTRNDSFERKSPQHRHSLSPLLGDGLFVSDGETWRVRRRTVAPIINTSRLPVFAPVMIETVLEARERWAQIEPPAQVDALGEMAQLTAEIICRTIFGRDLGREHAAEVVQSFSEYQHHILKVDLISLLDLPEWLPRWYPRPVRRSVKRIHAVLDDIIDELARRRDRAEATIIDRLFDACDPETGAPLGRQALRNEAAVLFMAGHETTANALAWTWYLLSQAPQVEARLHDELDTVLGGRAPALEDVPRLEYTRAVFEETLRLYPPVPVLSREAVKDEVFQGRNIPRGSLIMVCPWLLHRHRKFWKQPDHFVPERFLPGSGEPISRFAYIPFSTGPRVCAGMSFGLTEAILCIATLAQRFRLRLKPGHSVQVECRLTLRPGSSLPMTLERRDSPQRASAAASAAPAQVCPFSHEKPG